MSNHKRKKTPKPKDPAKEAAKKKRREEQKALATVAKKQAMRRRQIRQALIGAVAIMAVAAIGVALFRGLFPGELDGVQTFPNEGRGHLEPGQTGIYATATPTSGDHAANSPRCGLFNEPVPLELAIHGLEHGVVVIWYQQERADELAPGLRAIVNDYEDRVIVSPHANLDSAVVATAWTRSKAYDSVDPEIADFIETYRGRGPERVPCPIT